MRFLQFINENNVAQTIRKQLGGSLTMFGAKNLVSGDSKSQLIGYEKPHRGYLSFNVPRPRGAKIIILLTPKDTYDIIMGKADRSFNWKVLKSAEDVYADNLVSTLEKFTGMSGRL